MASPSARASDGLLVAASPILGERAPRSRKNRPCDRCRRAKSRCVIIASGPPCKLCNESSRQCTFDYAPPRRPIKIAPREGSASSLPDDALGSPLSAAPRSYGSPQTVKRSRTDIAGRYRPGDMTTKAVPSGLDVLSSAIPSFDHLADSRYDPHVLTCVLTDDLLPISGQSEGTPSREDPYVKQISSDPSKPIFVVMNPKPDASQQPVPGAVSLGLLRTFLRHQAEQISEARLLALYQEHVHPAIPILPPGPTESLPPSLLGMAMTTSMNHSPGTRQSAPVAYTMISAAGTPLPENNLAGVASAILELGVRPVNNSHHSYILLAKTVALAQLLGMHLDPTRWAIPAWEKDLRIRLWWMLAMHDAWMSFLNSRPALIQANNNSVPFPSFSSLLEASCAYTPASTDSAKSFIASCKLALLVRRLQSTVCTIGITENQSTVQRKDHVLAIADKVDQLYDDWKEQATGTRCRPTGVNSFLIHLLGLRCMLRRIHLELEHGLGSTFVPDFNVLTPFTDCVHFVSQLTETDCNGYYMNYASHVLSSVTSSLTRLALANPSAPHDGAMNILSGLIRSLNRYQTDYKWDIAAPALRRAAAVEGRLRSIGEHSTLAAALRGGDGDTASTTLPAFDPIQVPLETDPQFVLDWGGLDWNFIDMLGDNTVSGT